MPHRIGKHEDIGLALRRLAADDLTAARSDLMGAGPPARRAQRARRRLKRVRSVLRTLRPALDTRVADLSGRLRDAGRLLAEAHDTAAVAASARSLMTFADTEGAGLERVVAMLDREAQSRHSEAATFAEVIGLLAGIEREIAAIDDDMDGDRLLRRAIARAYRRGRTAMRRARFSLTTPGLHEWRKAAKDLRRLIRLARKRLPPAIAGRASQLKRLDEALGLDRDHAILAERLALSPEGDPALMRQLSLIAERRLSLESEAFALGAKLYRQKPETFRRRLRLR